MKKLFLVLSIISNDLISQDLISDGLNSWLFHTPDDGRTSLHVVPKINGSWSWNHQTYFENDGSVVFTGNVSVATWDKVPGFALTVGGDLNVGGYGDGILRVRHITGKHWQNEEVSDLHLNWGTGTNVHVGNLGAGGMDSDLLVSGRLGIGTANPQTPLHIAHSEDIGQWGGIRFYPSNSSSVEASNSIVGHKALTLTAEHPTGSIPAQVKLNDTGEISITGKVAIGLPIAHSDYDLDVNGKIRSQEVVVEVVNAPDYVFDSDYDLRSLEETKEYIEKNNHLPEIPSGEEMEQKGLSVGDMNMRLLKKIEELTLHQILLLEQLKDQNDRINEMEKDLESIIRDY